ncbi:MAG: hypothetical protein LIV22_00940 [Olegusella sp.]|nr:hypothetical protein [Olegusella sp.]
MALDEKKKLDLSRPAAELAREDKDFSAFLAELGFTELPADKTVSELAADAGISPSIVSLSLEAAGYDIGGYVAPSDGFQSPLPAVFGALFGKRSESSEEIAASSGAPMLTHMEAAVHRAQQEGVLPKDSDGTNHYPHR